MKFYIFTNSQFAENVDDKHVVHIGTCCGPFNPFQSFDSVYTDRLDNIFELDCPRVIDDLVRPVLDYPIITV